MAPREEWIKYVTQQFVTFIHTPTEIRQQYKTERKQRKEIWLVRWFGWFPFSIRMVWKNCFRQKENHLE